MKTELSNSIVCIDKSVKHITCEYIDDRHCITIYGDNHEEVRVWPTTSEHADKDFKKLLKVMRSIYPKI